MNSAEPKVIRLCERDAQGALERLNRITGLRFARWPQSLAPLARQVTAEEAAGHEPEAVERSVESA